MKVVEKTNLFAKFSIILTTVFLGILLEITSCSIASNQNLQAQINQSRNNNNVAISTATLVGATRSLSPNFMCYNVSSERVQSWHSQEFQQAIKKLNPRMLRIPGGDESNYWDWRRGGLIENTHSLPEGLPVWLKYEGQYTASKLEDYRAGLQATGTTPLFNLNMLTSDLESQIKMLQTAKKLGMQVKHIELGNEFYFGIPNYTSVFPNPQDYATKATQWISVIKKEFPRSEIAVTGVTPNDQNSGRMENWNNSLFNSALPRGDAITLHIYIEPGLDNTESSELKNFTKKEVPIILGEPFRNWQELRSQKDFKLIPANKKIWITEYNLIEKIFGENEGKKPKVMGRWIHGMFTSVMSLLFLEEPRVDIICNHDLIGDARFGAILLDDKSLKNVSNKIVSTKPLSLSATGSSLRLLGDTTKGMTTAHKINFSANSTLTGKDSFRYPALYGWMFFLGKDKQAVIMNLSAQNIKLNLSDLFSKSKINVKYNQISGEPETLVSVPGSLNESSGTVSQQIKLPAYSITKLFTQLRSIKNE